MWTVARRRGDRSSDEETELDPTLARCRGQSHEATGIAPGFAIESFTDLEANVGQSH